MPPPIKDKTGMKFGFWTIKGNPERKNNHTYWSCLCICGNESMVAMTTLLKGRSSSCGCKSRELSSEKTTKHGMAKTTTYKSWHAMIQRTQGKGGHQSYVSKNIKVCKEWLSFERFLFDMGEKPIGMSLDRIDNTKGYYKENCRWATPKQQSNNRDKTIYVSVNGETMTFMDACKKYKMTPSCARHRKNKGMNDNQVFLTAVRKRNVKQS